MKPARAIGYRKRLLTLVALGVLISGALLKKKVLPSWRAWEESRAMQREAEAGTDPAAALQEARSRLAALDHRIGNAATHGWRPVLDMLERDSTEQGIRLAAIAAEHRIDEDGVHINTLPLSLQGRTDDVVNAIAALERDAEGVHIVGIDLGAHETGYRSPRTLTATIYLQTVQP